jgi:16S rRNA (adenine1518-N6/adenine1519-N6)-dimethyltransferase
MKKNFSPNKDLGQHFLKDKNTINAIISDRSPNVDVIIEVGPGPAVLTKDLSLHQLPFYVIEMDRRFSTLLEKYVDEKNIFFQDALKFEWNDFIHSKNYQNKNIWLVSNLPYNVSAPLIVQFLQVKQITSMTLMMQKEVGEKILFTGKKNEMSSLKALCQSFFDCQRLCKVAPGQFFPPPKVDSVVISFRRKPVSLVNLDEFKYFEKFLRTIMADKRKMLRKAMEKLIPNQQSKEALNDSKIDQSRRAESLSLDEVHSLYRLITQMRSSTS